MDEVFDNEVLDDLYEKRSNGFQSYFVKYYGEPEEEKQERKSEKKLIDTIKNKIKDEKLQKEIIKLHYEVTDDMVGSQCFWNKQFYKLGFADRGNLMKLNPIDFYEESKEKNKEK